jgi:trehalose-6-phosphate synthase
MRIPLTSLTEQLKDVTVQSNMHVREYKGYFSWVQFQPVILLNDKRDVHGSQSLTKVTDLSPRDRIVKGLFHVITLL